MNIRKLQEGGVYTAKDIKECMTSEEWQQAEKVLAGKAWTQAGQKVWSGEVVRKTLAWEAIRRRNQR